jgi:hypothetical protein
MLDTVHEDLRIFYVVESDMNRHKTSLSNPNGIWLLQLPRTYIGSVEYFIDCQKR